MRILLKILFSPVMLALILFVNFFAFLLTVSSVFFGIAGTVFTILATSFSSLLIEPMVSSS